jgi:hypothetical protein
MRVPKKSETIATELRGMLKDQPFKTVFLATMGYYTAQFVATILGLVTLAGVGLLAVGIVALMLKIFR